MIGGLHSFIYRLRKCNTLKMPFELVWFALYVFTLILGELGRDF